MDTLALILFKTFDYQMTLLKKTGGKMAKYKSKKRRTDTQGLKGTPTLNNKMFAAACL